MAGSAIAVVISPDVRFLNPNETPYPGISMPLRVLFFDQGLGINDACGADVRFAPSATPQQIETAIGDAVLECKGSNFPAMSLARNDIIMVNFTRG